MCIYTMAKQWRGGVLRGQTGRCPHKIAKVYSSKTLPLVQPSNPDYIHLTHAVSMAVTEKQLQTMVMDPYRWLPRQVTTVNSTGLSGAEYFRGGNMLESVAWMWHANRTGIAVCIRNGELAMFVPFCNPNYTNTWSTGARQQVPRCGLAPEHWWANGWTLCGDVVSPQLWGDQGICSIQNMLMVACERGIMADCDFIINKRDSACVRLDSCDPMNPIDAYQQPCKRSFQLVPILSLYTGDQFADIAMPLPSDWHRLSRGTFQAQNPLPVRVRPKKIAWADKLDCAIFRGSLTGTGSCSYTNQRIALLMRHDGRNLDLRGTGANRRYRYCPLQRRIVVPSGGNLDIGRHHLMPLHVQQERYRYSITIDGHSGADRLAALADGGQIIFKVNAPYHALCPETWASQRMHAWEHYIPVQRDMSDLLDNLAWARGNRDACNRILRICDTWAASERNRILQWWVDAAAAFNAL